MGDWAEPKERLKVINKTLTSTVNHFQKRDSLVRKICLASIPFVVGCHSSRIHGLSMVPIELYKLIDKIFFKKQQFCSKRSLSES